MAFYSLPKLRDKLKIFSDMPFIIFHIIALVVAAISVKWSISFLENWESRIEKAKQLATFLENQKTSVEVFGTITLFAVFAFIFQVIKSLKKTFLFKNSGMFFYNKTGNDRVLNERALAKDKTCAQIYIQCATGWGTFGDPKSPLYDAICNCNDVKIILLNPHSKDAAKNRAEHITKTIEEFKGNIYKSIIMIEELRNKGYNISLKMYNEYPTWKVILTEQILWVQHYSKKGHIKESPSFGFENKKDSLYHAFQEHLQSYWNCPNLGEYIFATGEVVSGSGKREFIWPKELWDQTHKH